MEVKEGVALVEGDGTEMIVDEAGFAVQLIPIVAKKRPRKKYKKRRAVL
jgi:hypothetical protein